MHQKVMFGELCEAAFQSRYEAALKEGADKPVICSPGHYRKLRKIMNVKIPIKRTVAAKITIFLVAAAILLLTACSVIYKEEIGVFFVAFYEDYIHVCPSEGTNSDSVEIKTQYVLGYVPNGFTKGQEYKLPTFSRYEWSAGDKTIVFRQMTVWGNTTFSFENTQSIETFLFDFDVHYYWEREHRFWFWKNGDYYYMIESNVEFEPEEIQKMIEGIVEEK